MQFSRTAPKWSQKIHRAHLRSLQVKAFLPGLRRARPSAPTSCRLPCLIVPEPLTLRPPGSHLGLGWIHLLCSPGEWYFHQPGPPMVVLTHYPCWPEPVAGGPTNCSLCLSWMEEGMTKTEPLVFQQEQKRPRRQKPGGLFIPLLSQTSIY